MRRLRGFSKRRFGTAPTILGNHASRRIVGDLPNTLSRVQDLQSQSSEAKDDDEINSFGVGEVVAFRGTDGYPVNMIQLSRRYQLNELTPTTKIVGSFLVLVEDDAESAENAVFEKDPTWEGGSQPYQGVIRDNNGNIVTVGLQVATENGRFRYHLTRSVYEEICNISTEFENQLSEKLVHVEDDQDGDDCSEESEEIEPDDNSVEQQQKTLPSRRRTKGNRYASIIASLM